MQMSIHTGQHLLSAILDVHAEGLPTLSWGMPPHPSLDLPYVELPRGLTWAETEEIERKCNEAIRNATRVWVDVTRQEDGFVKTTLQGVRENRGIPEDYQDVRDSLSPCFSPLPRIYASILVQILTTGRHQAYHHRRHR